MTAGKKNTDNNEKLCVFHFLRVGLLSRIEIVGVFFFSSG